MIVLRTLGDPVSLWESLLPEELLRLPEQLARVDGLLDDPVFFAPFVPFFCLTAGRPLTPMECYLRLMYLKLRYGMGYETLCREVTDSFTWRRFCRISLDGRVPNPTTLMKLDQALALALEELNTELLSLAVDGRCCDVAASAGRHDDRCRRIVVPTDSGLCAKRCLASLGCHGSRRPAAPPGPGSGTAAGQRASARMQSPPSWVCAVRSAARKRRPRSGASLASWPWRAGRAAADARRLLANARRALRRAQARAAALAPPGCRIRAGPRRERFAARSMTWPGCWRRPAGSLRRPGSGVASPRTARPGGSACTTATPGRSPRAASASLSSSATKARSPTTTTASCWTTTWSRVTRLTPLQLAPAVQRVIRRTGRKPGTVTADRGYGEKAVDDALREMGVRHVVIPRKGKPGKERQAAEHMPAFRRTVKWRTGSEGRISTLKRGYGWDRTRLDSLEGARIWTGHGILAHNLVKIADLAS